jgi:hypothetical protein
MGNINMNNFICENYYCQSVSFKPEWLSENTWNIEYKYINNIENNNFNIKVNNDFKNELDNKLTNDLNNQLNNELNNQLNDELNNQINDDLNNKLNDEINNLLNNEINNDKNINKPFIIEKGILKIRNSLKNQIILSKKLLINLNDIKNLLIPINFKYNLKNLSSINFYIIFSNKEYNLCNNLLFLKENNDKHFYVKITFNKKNVLFSNSFDTIIKKYKLKLKKIYRFNINLENNYDMLLVNKNLINVFDEKYLIPFHFDNKSHYYLNLLINTDSNLSKNEFLELNFE